MTLLLQHMKVKEQAEATTTTGTTITRVVAEDNSQAVEEARRRNS